MQRIVYASIALLAAQMAPAQGKEAKPKPEWVIVPYFGQSDTKPSDLKIDIDGQNTHLTYNNVHWRDESYRGPLYYGFKAIYWPTPTATVGYGFDFIHYKVFAETGRTTQVSGTLNGNPYNQTEPISNTLGRFSISHGVNYAGLQVMGRTICKPSETYPGGRFQPYAGAGAGIVINHPESSIGGEFFEKYQYGGFSWQVFLGAEYRMNPKWGVFLEFKYTDYTPTVDTAQGGEGKARLKTNHLAFGTTYRLK